MPSATTRRKPLTKSPSLRRKKKSDARVVAYLRELVSAGGKLLGASQFYFLTKDGALIPLLQIAAIEERWDSTCPIGHPGTEEGFRAAGAVSAVLAESGAVLRVMLLGGRSVDLSIADAILFVRKLAALPQYNATEELLLSDWSQGKFPYIGADFPRIQLPGQARRPGK
jgi:hypothetical protein